MSTARRREVEDRRIIDRISSPHMRSHLRQIRWCLLFLTLLSGATAAFSITSGGTVTELSAGLFWGLCFFGMGLILWRYYKAVLLFLENESVSNLDRVMERQSIFWIAASFLSAIYAVSYVIFK